MRIIYLTNTIRAGTILVLVAITISGCTSNNPETGRRGAAITTSDSQPGNAGLPPVGVQSAHQVAPQPQPAPEDHDWDAALHPFSSAKVEAFLQRYPNGSHARPARQILEDEHVIQQIIASGPGAHFVLPKDSVPSRFISPESADNEERSRITLVAAGPLAFNSIEFGHMPIYNGRPVMPGGDLSVFVVSGTIDNIQGDAPDGIRILYSKRYGFIVIGGKGKIFSTHNAVNGDVIFQTP